MRATVSTRAAKSTICQVIEPRSTTSFRTAPKRNHNASESSAPMSSTRCSASAGSRRASGSKKTPATNAAMNCLCLVSGRGGGCEAEQEHGRDDAVGESALGGQDLS
jgi:hypothetical protein